MNGQRSKSVGSGARYALITGGSRGIGRATALRFAGQGIHVAFCFISNRTAAEETAREIQKRGVRALSIRANVRNEAHIERMFRTVEEEFGALDLFISNAATGVLKPVLELGAKEWERAMDVNVRSLLVGAQRAVPLMEGRRDPRIVAITSMGSSRIIPGYAAVGASKAALEALTRYLAVELKPLGINVNAICAGIVDTDSLELFPNRDEMLEGSRRRTPSGKIQTADDVARVVSLLCSPDSDWVVGETIIADGGYSIVG